MKLRRRGWILERSPCHALCVGRVSKGEVDSEVQQVEGQKKGSLFFLSLLRYCVWISGTVQGCIGEGLSSNLGRKRRDGKQWAAPCNASSGPWARPLDRFVKTLEKLVLWCDDVGN